MNFKKILGAAVASVMAISTMAVAANAATAGLIFKTDVWTYRNSLDQSKIYYSDEFNEAQEFDTWVAGDVEFTEDGTYTAYFEKSLQEVGENGDPETYWRVLKLVTNISPEEYPDLKITIDSLKVDGKEIAGATAAILGAEAKEASDYDDVDVVGTGDRYCLGFVNEWNADQNILDNKETFGQKVEVTFTVTGLSAPASGDNGANGGDEGNGDTSAPTADKNTPDTGVEGVAAVAGIAVLAAGAIIVAKKRK